MSELPYSYLEIPEQCLIEKRVYKKLFCENARLTATDRKWFTKDINSVRWIYSLKPSDTLIHAYKEENYTYDEIAVIEVELKNDHHVKRLADIIHRVIPYPLLIVFKDEDWVHLSVADKRFNLADHQAATLSELWMTDRLTKDDYGGTEQKFLQQLSYSRQPRLHMKLFYEGWIQAFIAYKISRISGEYTLPDSDQEKQKQVNALKEYRRLDQKIAELKTELNKQEAFNEKVKLNVDIKKLEKQRKQIAEKL
ncbi:MAG: DUF4391 domain-containing protein [Balneolaceae bacterium]